MAKCKFCGKDLKVGYEDFEMYFYCSCEGQKKASNLKDEIASLKYKVFQKELELDNLIAESIYGKILAKKNKLENELRYHFDDAIYKE